MDQNSTQQPLFPIGEVSRLTGINSITIRAWERRYNLIEPMRTDSGHRLYSMEQVEFLKTVLTYTERGLPISKVKEIISSKSIEIEQTTSLKFSVENFVSTLSRKDPDMSNRALDRLFADNPSNIALYNLIQISQFLTHEKPELSKYWQAFIQPRLQARLYQTLRLNSTHRSYAVIYALSEPDMNKALISAICLAEKGYYPFIFNSIPESHEISASLRTMNAQGVLWCYSKPEQLETYTQWIFDHGSFNALLVGPEVEAGLLRQLHVAHEPVQSAQELSKLSFDF